MLPAHENVQSLKLLLAKIARIQKIRSPKHHHRFLHLHHRRDHSTTNTALRLISQNIIKVVSFPNQNFPNVRNQTSIYIYTPQSHNSVSSSLSSKLGPTIKLDALMVFLLSMGIGMDLGETNPESQLC